MDKAKSVKIANRVLSSPDIGDVVSCLEWAIAKLQELGNTNEYSMGMVRSIAHAQNVAKYARENLI